MTTDIPLGTRVVVRYSLPPGSSHPMTDVIGILDGVEDAVSVRTADGDIVEIPADRVVAMKALTPRPIRTSEIRNLELVSADGWPGVELEWIDGWLCRYGHGFTGRANSATPLGEPGTVAPLDESTVRRLRDWYSDRDRPLRLLLPDRLSTAPDGWSISDEVVVMAADIDNLVLPAGDPVATIDSRPDRDWLALYRYRGNALPDFAVDVLTSVRGGKVAFARIGSEDSALIAVARGSVTPAHDGRIWVGLTAVEVAEAHRRHGIGTLICGDVVKWGREKGATHAYLQVAAENEGARSMYRSLGFVDHHRYRYATEHVGVAG